jgi:hypothetical protein
MKPPSISASGCSASVSAAAGSPDSACAVTEVILADGADEGTGVAPGSDLHAETVLLTGRPRGQAQVDPWRIAAEGISRRRGEIERREAVPLRDRLPGVEEPPACPGGD